MGNQLLFEKHCYLNLTKAGIKAIAKAQYGFDEIKFLEPHGYGSQKSFYNKAFTGIDAQAQMEYLFSYGTIIAKRCLISGFLYICKAGDYSMTTRRHLWSYMALHGFRNITLQEMRDSIGYWQNRSFSAWKTDRAEACNDKYWVHNDYRERLVA